MRALAAACLAVAVMVLPVRADEIARLMQALRFEETVGIMRAEGLRYGGDVGKEMLGDAERARWGRVVDKVYDDEAMLAKVSARFSEAMAGVDVATLLAFFEGPGAEIVALELAARRALLDDAAEAAAEAVYARMAAEGAPLVDQVSEIIADSDLTERNVAAALNSNLSFYRGLADGGGLDLGEDEMLAEIWAQEDEMRQQTGDWLHAYLVMAYEPLGAETLADYADLWRSAEGRDLNRALFTAYDAMYEDLSYRLGLAVALQMRGEDL
ncbi:hypothetical protein SAMN05443999_1126 [Roseovarius azorensis]|uniref:DUF2059 domain-containing protein n=1 Tax=Roseovarius azorensis TaxID=1287727 RepID=A0A1H7V9F8_9RHOB|nr:hypothetical protein [Roseovarius azorensis]SEM05578.1 hypothetical protein SAMN05443999_1126 [Roseovarius azorensis]